MTLEASPARSAEPPVGPDRVAAGATPPERIGPDWLHPFGPIRSAGQRAAYIALIVITGVFVALPVFYVFQEAFEDGFAGVRRLTTAPGLGKSMVNTLILVVGSSAIALVLGTGLAWMAHRLPAGRRWLGILPFLPLVVPQVALVTGYAFMGNPTIGYVNLLIRAVLGQDATAEGPINVYDLGWITVICGFSMTAFVFVFMRTSMSQLNQEIIDAGAASGAGPLRVFFTIVIPILRPALIYGTFTVLLIGMGQFTAPLLLGNPAGIDVLTTNMYRALNGADSALAAAFGLPILVAGLALLVVQRFALRNPERFVTAGGRSSRPLSRTGITGQLLLVAFGLVAVVIPLIGLVIVSVQPYWSQFIDPSAFTLQNFIDVLTTPNLADAIRNSLLFAFGTVLIALPLAHICARVIYRRSKHPVISDIQDTIVNLPLGIPAAIFGVGFLVLYTSTPVKLYGNGWGVVLLYVAIVLPLALRLQLAGLANLGTELNSAAAVSGAGLFRRIFTIDVPLLRPAFGSAAALIVVIASHEFTASLLIRSARTQVMGTALYDLFNFGIYPSAAAMAFIMCLVTVLGVGVAFLIGGGGAFNQLRGRN